ncbi:SAM-dependent methyltransferase [soil metagenome]
MTQPVKFDFEDVVFFGRCIDEYVAMFNLDLEAMRGQQILDCSSGPAAFALEAAAMGIHVTGCDPLYVNDVATLRNIVDDHSAIVYEKQKAAISFFHPEVVSVPQRRKAMDKFLKDFVQGKLIGRYVPGVLPNLPFASNQFDTTLCANLLFLYSDIASGGMLQNSNMEYKFHSKALHELLRVSKKDVRIYPLQGPNVSEHHYIPRIMKELSDEGFKCELTPVKQRDIIGAEMMLQVSKSGSKQA